MDLLPAGRSVLPAGKTFAGHQSVDGRIRVGPQPANLRPARKSPARSRHTQRTRCPSEPALHSAIQRQSIGSSAGARDPDTLEDLYNHLSRDLTSLAPATVAVILYPDQIYFDITQAPSWTGAVFDGKIRVPTRGLTGVTDRLRAILAHELAHSFIASLPGRGSPIWFQEGVAQLQEGKSAANARKLLAQLQRENHLTPLKNLRDSFMGLSPDTAGIAYAESLSAVEYLASQFGRPAIRNLLDLMGQNYNFENAFRTALQRSVSEFESAWQQDLTQ